MNKILRQALEALVSPECYCGSSKQEGHTFCNRCYNHLPPRMRVALYSKRNYGHAWKVAVEWLQENVLPKQAEIFK